jgi:transposase
VNIDYHFDFERHHYSVPYQLVGQRIDVRATTTIVEAFHKGRRVASHRRALRPNGFTTERSHRPTSHQRYAEWSPSRLIRWAETIGPDTGAVIAEILRRKPHPEQGFRSCLGIIRLTKRFGSPRVERACRRARTIGSFSYRSIQSILKTRLDQHPLPTNTVNQPPLIHENIRGAQYFDQTEEKGETIDP